MGKGLDTCLVVQPMTVKTADPVEETAEDLMKQLDSIQKLPESESYPLFHLLPEVVQHYTKLLTLPNELKDFITSRRPPADCLRLCKEVAIATYEVEKVQTHCAHMHVQDPEFKARALWEGMGIVRPWDEIPAEVLAMEPHIYEETSTRNSYMSDEQKEVFQEVQGLVDIADFMHYWSRKGCTLELETEYHE
ncbi:g2910 [Coccomyxa elongata]